MIRAIAIDAAFANMGLASVTLEKATPLNLITVRCLDLKLITTGKESNKKQVRVSSDDLRRVNELALALAEYCHAHSPQFAFVEVPSGAMDARAARGLGMATGVLGVLAVLQIPVIEVSPMEVKVAVTGNRKTKASKLDIIKWAGSRWPDAPWLRHQGRVTLNNEHLADALAIATAGTATPAFQQLMALSNHATTSPDRQRPASGRVALL